MLWPDGRGEGEREERVLKTQPATASQEHRVLHKRGGNGAGPHGEGSRWLTNPEEWDAQADARRSSQGSWICRIPPGNEEQTTRATIEAFHHLFSDGPHFGELKTSRKLISQRRVLRWRGSTFRLKPFPNDGAP